MSNLQQREPTADSSMRTVWKWVEINSAFVDLCGLLGIVIAVKFYLNSLSPGMAAFCLGVSVPVLFLGIIAQISRSRDQQILTLGDLSQDQGEPTKVRRLTEPKPNVTQDERLYELKKREPNLVLAKTSLISVHEDERGGIMEGNNQTDLTLHAVVAEFNNAFIPNRSIGPIDGISARLTYSTFDSSPSVDVMRGVWVTSGAKVDFEVNDTHRLIIATIEGFEQRHVYMRDGSYLESRTRRISLSENLIKVKVSLASESESRMIGDFAFMIETKRESDVLVQVHLTEMRRWKHAYLVGFIRQGIGLQQRCQWEDGLTATGGIPLLAKDQKPLEEESDGWATNIARFLATHHSPKHEFEFRKLIAPNRGQQTYVLSSTIRDVLNMLYDLQGDV